MCVFFFNCCFRFLFLFLFLLFLSFFFGGGGGGGGAFCDKSRKIFFYALSARMRLVNRPAGQMCFNHDKAVSNSLVLSTWTSGVDVKIV